MYVYWCTLHNFAIHSLMKWLKISVNIVRTESTKAFYVSVVYAIRTLLKFNEKK
jgi:hypothetical protein